MFIFHRSIKIKSLYKSKYYYLRNVTCDQNKIVLGIETSCDDTGVAVVDLKGSILGDSLFSQNSLHVRYGGINPLVARDLHRENIETAVDTALVKAGLKINNIDAVAVTVKPGLLVILQIGVKYARYLAKSYNKPLIPIHHMEAHALVARMFHKIDFPFLTILISGGHCLLALVKDVEEFLLIGKSLDNPPGEVLDKAARRMKLRNIPAYSKLSGGKAIEEAAKNAKKSQLFKFPLPLAKYRDCNFSFSGVRDALFRHIVLMEKEHDIKGDETIPDINDICAAFQLVIAEHIVHRTERALLYCLNNNLLCNNNKCIVVSGGVACNNFIFNSIQKVASKLGCNAYRPPPHVCTDNGIMVAWNGVEKLLNKCSLGNVTLEDIDPKAPLGINIINKVKNENLYVKATKLNKLVH